MKRLIALCMLLAAPAFAAIETGQPAPSFTAQTASGQTVSLSQFEGKPVVLEWTNHGCPFVKKFYKGGDMQSLQATATKNGVVWLRVISSAPGKQGHLSAQEATQMAEEQNVAATHTLLDASGALGRLYGAKTTPHMYVISAQGTLAYQGAIDSNASADSADIAGATNYVMSALAALAKGETPATANTRSYGCSIKY